MLCGTCLGSSATHEAWKLLARCVYVEGWLANQFNCVPFPLWALPCCQTARGKGGQIPQCARLGVGATSYGNNFKNNNKLSLEKFFGFVCVCVFFFTAHPFLDRMPNVLAWKGGYPLLLPSASFRFCSQIATCCLCAHVCVLSNRIFPLPFALFFFFLKPAPSPAPDHPTSMETQECQAFSAAEGFPRHNFWGEKFLGT